jgi:glycosyltransferase involved in cell wall biosynthesis
MKILFTSPILEFPAAGGPQLRMENSIKALKQVATNLTIVSRVNANDLGGEDAVRHYQGLSDEFLFSPSAKRVNPSKLRRRIQMAFPQPFDYLDARFLVQQAKRIKPDVIWFGYGNLSHHLIQAFKTYTKDFKLVCDTDSVWSRFLEREIPFAPSIKEKAKLKRQVKLKQVEEKMWVKGCHKTLAVSEVDAQYYRKLSDEPKKVSVFANVLDVAQYTQPEVNPMDIKQPSMYLAGTFGKPTSAMNMAATWVIDEILPLVKQTIPDIHFYIVGNYSDVAFGHIKDPAISVLGKVKSVLPILKKVNVALTPLKYESGTRFKILEAGACKIPMVSTTLGAEGLNVKHQQDLLIADTADDFAKCIIQLIQDETLAKQLKNHCYQTVNEQYSLQTLSKQAKTILDTLS